MAGRGRAVNFSSGFAARAAWLASRIGMGLNQLSGADDRSTDGRISNARGSGRRRIAGQPEAEVAEEDEGEEVEREYEDEEEFGIDCLLEEDEDEVRDAEGDTMSEDVYDTDSDDDARGPTDHVLVQTTKCRTAASAGSSQFGKAKSGAMVNTLAMVLGREINVSGNGKFSRAECCHVASHYLPTDGPRIVQQQNSRAYTGQFSADGSLFVAGFQDRRVRIYNVEKDWQVQKDVCARNLRWTVTDTALSPDQRFLVYASITPFVHLVNVGSESGGIQSLANVTDIHEGLNFAADARGESMFGIWSVQFSHDGREIVAGSNDKSIYVYDLEANKPAFRIVAHKDDVNAVVFADNSGHLIYSGSDDRMCKVWDRRLFGPRCKPVGVLEGHLEGITFLDSYGDGQYFISNSKDQTIKLWDIRKMSSSQPSSRARSRKVPAFRWDYRWMDYPGMGKGLKHPYDQSLMTYKGHLVLRTLVRCYFSPVFSTGQKYIYTGSHDGFVYIYDLVTGKQVAKLSFHVETVRDVNWHPTLPIIVSSSWDGCIAKWEFQQRICEYRYELASDTTDAF